MEQNRILAHPHVIVNHEQVAGLVVGRIGRQEHSRLLSYSIDAQGKQIIGSFWVILVVSVISALAGVLMAIHVRTAKPWSERDRGFISKEVQDDLSYDNFVKTIPMPSPVSNAKISELYMYRATGKDWLHKYPFGNINTANLDGAMWYILNEVVTKYSAGTRCPRKFGISEIHRFKVSSRATDDLFQEGMNFGVRFAYDQGMCRGRCFPDNMCSCEPDCEYHYKKYGYVPGCNRFTDKYPFPAQDTSAPSGIWYSLPLEGRCEYPTGSHNCTWSYEHAGTISLEDLENTTQGMDNCCHGNCTNFWVEPFNVEKSRWRVNKALDLFERRYSNLPRELQSLAPACDFQWWKWYSMDPWPKVDPWKRDKALKKAQEAKKQTEGE